jgi:hypothetical protein
MLRLFYWKAWSSGFTSIMTGEMYIHLYTYFYDSEERGFSAFNIQGNWFYSILLVSKKQTFILMGISYHKPSIINPPNHVKTKTWGLPQPSVIVSSSLRHFGHLSVDLISLLFDSEELVVWETRQSHRSL